MKAMFVVRKESVAGGRRYGITFSDKSNDDNTFYFPCPENGWLIASVINSVIENFGKDDTNRVHISHERDIFLDDGSAIQEETSYVNITPFRCIGDSGSEFWFATNSIEQAKKAVRLIKHAIGLDGDDSEARCVTQERYGITFAAMSDNDNTFYIPSGNDGKLITAAINSVIENFSKEDGDEIYVAAVEDNIKGEKVHSVVVTPGRYDDYPDAECWFICDGKEEADKAVRIIREEIDKKTECKGDENESYLCG